MNMKVISTNVCETSNIFFPSYGVPCVCECVGAPELLLHLLCTAPTCTSPQFTLQTAPVLLLSCPLHAHTTISGKGVPHPHQGPGVVSLPQAVRYSGGECTGQMETATEHCHRSSRNGRFCCLENDVRRMKELDRQHIT